MRRAFTLIEVLVVIVLIALVAAMTLPRLTGNEARAARLAVEDVADLLTIFAHRVSMGQTEIAIGYDPDSRSIMLLRLVGSPTDPNDPPRWEIDRFENPVVLPESITIAGVREDGMAVERADWFIPALPGQGRPAIEMALVSADFAATVALPADGVAARILWPGQATGAFRATVDLDALGRDREVW
jgi:prepilin-type N-terminal cleavage/methylation domain-containing protein